MEFVFAAVLVATPPPIVADATPGMPMVPLAVALGVTVSVDAVPDTIVDGVAIQFRIASHMSFGVSICEPKMNDVVVADDVANERRLARF